jgi:hypothetical protein
MLLSDKQPRTKAIRFGLSAERLPEVAAIDPPLHHAGLPRFGP